MDEVALHFIALFPVAAATYALVRLRLWQTYYRLAPGVVQVVRFGLFRRKPAIVSFPMGAGTLVVVSALGKTELRIAFKRGEQERRINIVKMRNLDKVAEQFWWALLSTAPTPPMSEDELVG
jgi:hypothetical protein